MRVLLITPPFTQVNTPYPATTVLKGYLKSHGEEVEQMDLGIELINKIFSRDGLHTIFEQSQSEDMSESSRFVYEERLAYENTIDSVIRFLQGKDQTIANRIINHTLLPEGARFGEMTDVEWAFGTSGKTDLAKYLATLYIEDLTDFIKENIDENFGLVKYAEHLASYAPKFDKIEKSLKKENSIIDEWMLELLDKKLEETKAELVGFSVPFPGCLYAALKSGDHIKTKDRNVRICMGGGYANTELRNVSDKRLFNYIDYMLLDDGEIALTRLCSYLEGKTKKENLVRTFYVENDSIKYSGNDSENLKFCETGTPDFSGLKMDMYLQMADVQNPMQSLWSSGKWNKMVMAHGCYWAKCAFCDVTLDYIKRYDAPSAKIVVDRMESIMRQTGESGFHFTDEAMPPRLIKEVCNEIISRHLTVSWWGNIRFDKTYDKALCNLMADAGCIAVSGGLEVASDRLLELMRKGVTVGQTARATKNLTEAGIMVHAYLMYGFPTESLQECVDALEVVRQMFEAGLMQSAFWHRYAMTMHSPSGKNPELFNVKRANKGMNPFGNNEIEFTEEIDYDSDKIGEGLKIATYNFMNGAGFDMPLHKWFKCKVPHTTIDKKLISKAIR